MRRQRLVAAGLALVVGCAGSVFAASGVSKADQAFFDSHIQELVTLKPKPLESAALAKISGAKFYNVDVVMNGEAQTLTVARLDDKLMTVALPDTTAVMPDFGKMLKPDFKLKTDEDAHALQDALDVLYPIDGQDDNAAKTIKHSGNTWTFIRGKFFEHFKGLILTTDDSGKVTSVKYDLSI